MVTRSDLSLNVAKLSNASRRHASVRSDVSTSTSLCSCKNPMISCSEKDFPPLCFLSSRISCTACFRFSIVSRSRALVPVVIMSMSIRPVRGSVAVFWVATCIKRTASSTSSRVTTSDDLIFAIASDRRIKDSSWRGVAVTIRFELPMYLQTKVTTSAPSTYFTLHNRSKYILPKLTHIKVSFCQCLAGFVADFGADSFLDVRQIHGDIFLRVYHTVFTHTGVLIVQRN